MELTVFLGDFYDLWEVGSVFGVLWELALVFGIEPVGGTESLAGGFLQDLGGGFGFKRD
ncbi:MAG: hypothetical protein JSV09_03455 [Thermoplasmata archaeon]|nr:MAG: hypothetical protein JSV09_03455 [Thermoplasmata archaeon]